MKNALVVLALLSLTIGGCARPINQSRPRAEQRQHRRPAPDRELHRGDRDNRPNSY